jgi:ABC-type transport system involved in cytochrome c biogenesis ATPase subunit
MVARCRASSFKQPCRANFAGCPEHYRELGPPDILSAGQIPRTSHRLVCKVQADLWMLDEEPAEPSDGGALKALVVLLLHQQAEP